MATSDSFCTGGGRVMLPGFQRTEGGPCVLYLFQGAVVNTRGKYVVAVLATIAMGVCMELIRQFRSNVRTKMTKTRSPPLLIDSVSALLFGAQMIIAYWMMLVAMLYESGLFVSLIVGLAVGHMLSLTLQRRQGTSEETQPLYASPCCGESDTAEARPAKTQKPLQSCCADDDDHDGQA